MAPVDQAFVYTVSVLPNGPECHLAPTAFPGEEVGRVLDLSQTQSQQGQGQCTAGEAGGGVWP